MPALGVDVRPGWEPRLLELIRQRMAVVLGVLGLAVLAFLLTHTRTAGGALAALVCAILLILALVRAGRLFPLQDRRRPRISRIEGDAGPVDVVLFSERRTMTWCFAGAWAVAAALFYVWYWHRAPILHDPPVVVLTSPEGLAYVMFCGLCVWRARRARHFAVASDALILRYRRIRMRIPWDDLAEAWSITEMNITVWGGRPGYVRFIELIPRPRAVAPPGFTRSFAPFGQMLFLSREIGRVPAVRVDELAAPHALLRAIHWHLARPRTSDTLIEGYEHDWVDEGPGSPPGRLRSRGEHEM